MSKPKMKDEYELIDAVLDFLTQAFPFSFYAPLLFEWTDNQIIEFVFMTCFGEFSKWFSKSKYIQAS